MAITEQTPQHDYTAASGQTEFIFTFTLFDSLDAIKVFVGGVEKVRNTDYNVYTSDGSNILITDFPLTGGKVVFNAGLTAGDLVTLVRDTTISRSTDYNNNSSFDADTFDESLDKGIAILQDQRRRLDAKIGAPEGDTVADLTLPPQAERASKVLAFDVNGRFIASAGSNIPVTSFMAQVLDDADASTALGTLGFSTLAKTLIGNSDASTARETLLVPRKNYLINGNFDIWQRGTSFSFNNNASYAADRWIASAVPSGGQVAITRETFPPGQTEVPSNPKYYLSFDKQSVGTTQPHLIQRAEAVRELAGQTITASLYARGSVSTSLRLQAILFSGSVLDTVDSSTATLTTSWAKYSFTVTLPSITSSMAITSDAFMDIRFFMDSDIAKVDFAQVQFGGGNVATEFEYRHIADELALCQRYLYPFSGYATAYRNDNAQSFALFDLPSPMRTIPSISNFTIAGATLINSYHSNARLQFFMAPSSPALSAGTVSGFADAEL